LVHRDAIVEHSPRYDLGADGARRRFLMMTRRCDAPTDG